MDYGLPNGNHLWGFRQISGWSQFFSKSWVSTLFFKKPQVEFLATGKFRCNWTGNPEPLGDGWVVWGHTFVFTSYFLLLTPLIVANHLSLPSLRRKNKNNNLEWHFVVKIKYNWAVCRAEVCGEVDVYRSTQLNSARQDNNFSGSLSWQWDSLCSVF